MNSAASNREAVPRKLKPRVPTVTHKYKKILQELADQGPHGYIIDINSNERKAYREVI
jgi:hypothetical protein